MNGWRAMLRLLKQQGGELTIRYDSHRRCFRIVVNEGSRGLSQCVSEEDAEFAEFDMLDEVAGDIAYKLSR
ncbi:hypothetical protein [Candidatus Laterigemmans baculatus]|uniref:hypothetical protein n=1 Tax=Candidatus Laterigemmans baculatus TaxID=2770505 RepID=UPI0013DD1F06|nr:hypothetical protein [Candidatus Laterigemmans baculatus]